MCFIRRFLMRKAKKLSITLMASVMALGVVAFTAQPANASYGYKYTDSIRPPVLTPTPSTGKAPMEPVTTTVTPAPAAKTTTTVEPTKTASSVTTANTTNNTDKTAQDILSSLLSLLQNLFYTLFK